MHVLDYDPNHLINYAGVNGQKGVRSQKYILLELKRTIYFFV